MSILDLNEDTVYETFIDCLPKDDSQDKDLVLVQIMSAENGFTTVDNPITIDKSRVMAHKEEIDELFGQLFSVHHSKVNVVDVNDVYRKYDGSYWARQPASILQLCYMGILSGNCFQLYNNTKYQKVVLPLRRGIKPVE